MTTILERPVAPSAHPVGSGSGGVAARRAVMRWAWRLFRREWRQQLLILSLIVVATAAVLVGAATSSNSPQPNTFGFGTARYSATFAAPNAAALHTTLSTLGRELGQLDVIENQSVLVPGTVDSFDMRAQDPAGPFGGPLLTLAIARSLGTRNVLALEQANVNLSQARTGSNNFTGQLYVATPALLRSYGITSRDYSAEADILTVRPGFAGEPNMTLSTSGGFGPGPNGSSGSSSSQCTAANGCIRPVMEQVGQLPIGVSAPNTVVTEHALSVLHARNTISTTGWLITTPGVLTASQISGLRSAAAADGLTIETKNDEPSSWQVVDWATVAGIALALAVLAMTIGLLRSETASDLRTLAATGASSTKRRSITASTAGAMALLGALLGTTGGYLACAAIFRTGNLAGQSLWTNLSAMPASNLLIILVGMPLVAVVGGWIFAGRQPPLVSRQPLE